MADLDAELARFEAELAAVEQEVQPAATDSSQQQHPPGPSTHAATMAAPPATAPPARPAVAAAPAAAPPQQHHAVAPGPMYHQYNPPAAQLPPPPMAPPPMYPPPPAAAYGMDPNQGYYMPQPPAMEPAYPAGPTMMGSTLSAAPVFTAPPVAPAGDDATYANGAGLYQQHQHQQQEGAPAKAAKDFQKQPGKLVKRHAAGETWWDPTLSEWPENDFRIFVGDLGNEVNDDILTKAFQHIPSFAKARVVRDKRSNKSKGFGFVSFLESADFAKALREMDGKYIGNRPCKLRKSEWQERNAFARSKWDKSKKQKT